ncbi:putative alpha-amylase [Helianthus anomalus]
MVGKPWPKPLLHPFLREVNTFNRSKGQLSTAFLMQEAVKGQLWQLHDAEGKLPGVMGWWISRAATCFLTIITLVRVSGVGGKPTRQSGLPRGNTAAGGFYLGV